MIPNLESRTVYIAQCLHLFTFPILVIRYTDPIMTQAPGATSTITTIGFGASDVGRRRERNEDSFSVDPALQLYIVADGMGGHVGGGLASRMAVQTISRVIAQLESDPDITTEASEVRLEGHGPAAILRYAIHCASRDIFERATRDTSLRGMGTTVVVLWVRDGFAYMANVGDSRGYVRRDGKLQQLTIDHSLVGEQIRAGILSETDAKTHRYKNIITRSVGFQPVVDVDIEQRRVRSGDQFLLCSDGLTNMVNDDTLHMLLATNEIAQCPAALVALANENGGDDNITVLVVHAVETGGDATAEDTDATQPGDEWDEPTEQLVE